MEHSHGLDTAPPSSPIAWAPDADATVITRLYAFCRDQCEECITALIHEVSQSSDTTAVLMGTAMSIAKHIPPALFLAMQNTIEYGPSVALAIDRMAAAGDNASGDDLLGLMREMDVADRISVCEASAKWMHLYTSTL
jgi:hypothetical protein